MGIPLRSDFVKTQLTPYEIIRPRQSLPSFREILVTSLCWSSQCSSRESDILRLAVLEVASRLGRFPRSFGASPVVSSRWLHQPSIQYTGFAPFLRYFLSMCFNAVVLPHTSQRSLSSAWFGKRESSSDVAYLMIRHGETD